MIKYKTLQECKDEIVTRHTGKGWDYLSNDEEGIYIDECMELYASQYRDSEQIIFVLDSIGEEVGLSLINVSLKRTTIAELFKVKTLT